MSRTVYANGVIATQTRRAIRRFVLHTRYAFRGTLLRMSTVIPLPAPTADRLNDLVQRNVLGELARRRVTQRQAAAMLGQSEQAFSDKLRGRTRLTLDDLQRLAELLGMEPEALLRRPEGWAPRGSNSQPAVYTSAQVIRGPWAPRLVASVAAVSA